MSNEKIFTAIKIFIEDTIKDYFNSLKVSVSALETGLGDTLSKEELDTFNFANQKDVELLGKSYADGLRELTDKVVDLEHINNNLREDLSILREDHEKVVKEKAEITETLSALIELNKKNVTYTKFENVTKTIDNINNFINEELKKHTTSISELDTKLVDVNSTFESRMDTFVEDVSTFKKQVDSDFTYTISDFDEMFSKFKSEALLKFDDHVERIDLKLSDIQSKELLKLNDRVQTSLNALKGEKGDKGDAGQKGESGFLSGVSVWENGSIAKCGEAFSHRNGLWLCDAEQTAREPDSECSDWKLVNDGVSKFYVDDYELKLYFSSGKEFNLGQVGWVHRGDFDADKIYRAGDVVIRNNTAFVSLKNDNTDHPPGNSWRKIVSKGSPGQKGKDGPKGEKGDKGDKGDVGESLKPEDMIPMVTDIVSNMTGTE